MQFSCYLFLYSGFESARDTKVVFLIVISILSFTYLNYMSVSRLLIGSNVGLKHYLLPHLCTINGVCVFFRILNGRIFLARDARREHDTFAQYF